MNPSFEKEVHLFYRSHGISPSFPKNVMREAKSNASDISHEVKERLDLRHLNAFTIDPADARDFDDALSAEWNENGRLVVGVHIADVSYWVPGFSQTDREARKRGNSFYFPWGFVPMLPGRLTTDLCSLVPDQDRLAVSCLFSIRGNQIENFMFAQSIIRSKRRLTYGEAQAILDSQKENAEPWLIESLQALHAAGLALRQKREKRGGLDFDVPEYGVRLDERGNPQRFFARPVLESNRLVEDWMLETNETVARYLNQKGVPILYRNHERPAPEDIQEFQELCRSLEVPLVGKGMMQQFKSALKAVEHRPEAAIFHRLFLRTLQKAKYEHHNKGHFGIGASLYTHFTSPIRRYPDLAVHRALKKTLGENRPHPQRKKHVRKAMRAMEEDLRELGFHCSECEEHAMKMEREAYKWLACLYMEGKEGSIYTGLISGIKRFGVFVELKEVPVEGLILRRDLHGGFFKVDESGLGLRARDIEYRLGQEIEVIVKRSNPSKRQLDFLPK